MSQDTATPSAGGAPTPLYFDDFAVGQTYRSAALEVDAAAIKGFAAQFDPQPFHLDEETAKPTFFRGLAASGWHTAALTMRLMVGAVPIAGGIIGAGMEEMRWPKPVRPGDRLRVEVEVLDLRASRSRPEQGLMKTRTTTLNQNGEAVQILVGSLVVMRRAAG